MNDNSNNLFCRFGYRFTRTIRDVPLYTKETGDNDDSNASTVNRGEGIDRKIMDLSPFSRLRSFQSKINGTCGSWLVTDVIPSIERLLLSVARTTTIKTEQTDRKLCNFYTKYIENRVQRSENRRQCCGLKWNFCVSFVPAKSFALQNLRSSK